MSKINILYVFLTLSFFEMYGQKLDLGNLLDQDGKKIQLMYSLEINQAVFDAGYYGSFQELYKEIVNKHTEKIVLKKT